jgi:hypothetical protein
LITLLHAGDVLQRLEARLAKVAVNHLIDDEAQLLGQIRGIVRARAQNGIERPA